MSKPEYPFIEKETVRKVIDEEYAKFKEYFQVRIALKEIKKKLRL